MSTGGARSMRGGPVPAGASRTTCPTGCSSRAARAARRRALRRPGARPGHRAARRGVRGADPDPLHGQGPHRLARHPDLIANKLTSDLAITEPHLIPLDQVRLHMPFVVADYVDFYSLAASTPPTSAGCSGRAPNGCCPTGGTFRSATTAASGTVVVSRHPDRAARAASAGAGRFRAVARSSTSRPSWFRGRRAVRAGNRPPGLRGPRVRRGAGQRLERARHPGAGSTCRSGRSWASRSPPRSRRGSSRWTRSRRCRAPRAGPRTARLPAQAGRLGAGRRLEVDAQRRGRVPPAVAGMYWTPARARPLRPTARRLRTGDLFASGTISGERARRRGSLIELTWNGSD